MSIIQAYVPALSVTLLLINYTLAMPASAQDTSVLPESGEAVSPYVPPPAPESTGDISYDSHMIASPKTFDPLSASKKVPEELVEVPEELVEVPEELVEVPEELVEVPEEPVEAPTEPVEVPEEPVEVPKEEPSPVVPETPVIPVVGDPDVVPGNIPTGPVTTVTATLYSVAKEYGDRYTGFHFKLPPLPENARLVSARLRLKNKVADGEYIKGILRLYADKDSHSQPFRLANLPSGRQLSTAFSDYVAHQIPSVIDEYQVNVTAPVSEVLLADRCNPSMTLVAINTEPTRYTFFSSTLNSETVFLDIVFAGNLKLDTAKDARRCMLNETLVNEINAIHDLQRAGIKFEFDVSKGVLHSDHQSLHFMLAPFSAERRQSRTAVTAALDMSATGEIILTTASGQHIITRPMIQSLPLFVSEVRSLNGQVTVDEKNQVLVSLNNRVYQIYPDISSSPAGFSSTGLHINSEHEASLVFFDESGELRRQRLLITEVDS